MVAYLLGDGSPVDALGVDFDGMEGLPAGNYLGIGRGVESTDKEEQERVYDVLDVNLGGTY